MSNKNNKIIPCIIGLGYVGLPLLVNLSKKYMIIGYDNNQKRIQNLKLGLDIFGEFKARDLKYKNIHYTKSLNDIKNCNLFIITVPTPIFKNKQPDLRNLKDVCQKLSKIIKSKDIIIFESTVYPGLTNDFCIPILEKNNNLKEGKDFFVGYSPERVNPGDKNHVLKKINKILAYPNKFKIRDLIKVYSLVSKKVIISKNIKEAETAKVIENIQRDVNIGLINEIYLVCKKLKLDFNNIINLASTKWNFVKYTPGLVGGHCLPVDPYYFSYICKKKKINNKITLAGRYINDSMLKQAIIEIKQKLKKYRVKKNDKILICGLTYKENVADIRNSMPLKILKNLQRYYKNLNGYDPLIDQNIAIKKGLITSYKEFLKYKIYVIITKHKKLVVKINKIKNKKIINIFN